MISSKILERLDLSDDFWDQFNVQNKKLKKQVGLFETESINTPNIITISINPEEYYFPNGIVSLPFGHFLFDEMRKKKTQNRNIHLQIKDKKWEFIKKENEILNKNERLLIFCQVINGSPILYTLQSQTPTILPLLSTKEYIEKYWI